MNKWYFMIGVVMFVVIGLAFAVETGILENPLGGVTTASKIDLVLKPEIKDVLENYSTVDKEVCETECLELDIKTGECLKLADEPTCTTQQEIKGITKINIVPTRKTETQTCYSFKDTNGLINIEEQCLDNSTTPETYIEKRLNQLGEEKIKENNESKTGEPLPNPIEINIK